MSLMPFFAPHGFFAGVTSKEGNRRAEAGFCLVLQSCSAALYQTASSWQWDRDKKIYKDQKIKPPQKRKQGRKEGRNEGGTESRKEGGKEERRERNEEGRKDARKGRKEGREADKSFLFDPSLICLVFQSQVFLQPCCIGAGLIFDHQPFFCS